MIRIKSCVACADRYLGCHSECERYLAEKKEKEAEKTRYMQESVVVSFKQETIERMKRRRHERRKNT